jgi:hypothetical protein
MAVRGEDHPVGPLGQVALGTVIRHRRAGGQRVEEGRPVAVVDGGDERPHGGVDAVLGHDRLLCSA